MIPGVDYSFTRPDIPKLAARGYRFAGRYVGLGTPGKRLTRGEAESLNRHGLRCVSLAEADERGALGGLRAGESHAAIASLGAASAGAPPNAPIYFAVDFAPNALEMRIVAQYFKGIANVLPHDRIGAYGGYATIATLFSGNLIQWGFQTYAWSSGRWHPWARLRQVRNHLAVPGGVVDVCEAHHDQYGGWLVDEPVIESEDDELTPEEKAAFHIQRWRLWAQQIGQDPVQVPAWPELNVTELREPNWQARTLRAIAAELGLRELESGEWVKPQATGSEPPRGSIPPDLEGLPAATVASGDL